MLKIILRLGYIKLRFQLNKLTRLVLLCLAFLSTGLAAQENKFSLSSYGDEFSSEPDKFFYFNNLDGVLFLNGTIEKGMYTNFRQAITENKIHTIVLNSLGGNVEEGLNIAGTVFDKGIKTYIPINYECYSACSFIFLAGSEKYALGELGVHQAAYADDISKEKAAIGAVTTVSQLTTADILLRLGEFNTPRFVEQRMLRTAPEDMYVFNEKELNRLGNLDVSNNNKALFKNIDKFIDALQTHYAELDCDSDITKCSHTQLCSRAAKNKSWLTTTKAKKYVIAAKKKGLSCGVPIPQCPENIKKCNKEYLCRYGTTGMDSGLSWLNNSFADEAKSRGYSCAIVSKPVIKTETKKSKCENNPSFCSLTQICELATTQESDSRKGWETKQLLKPYVYEAKRRGLSCGTGVTTCFEDAKKCTPEQLCRIATVDTVNGKQWIKANIYKQHVLEAARLGNSCGVKTKSVKDWENICDIDIYRCSPEYLSPEYLCTKATQSKNSNILWETSSTSFKFVFEAQKRGLSCGVNHKTQFKTKKETISKIQNRLNILGCDAGPVDGKLGPKTLSALKRWKARGGIYTINNVNLSLLNKLNSTSIKCLKKLPSTSAANENYAYFECNLKNKLGESLSMQELLTRKILIAYSTKKDNSDKTVNNTFWRYYHGGTWYGWKKLGHYSKRVYEMTTKWHDWTYSFHTKSQMLNIYINHRKKLAAHGIYDCKSFNPM